MPTLRFANDELHARFLEGLKALPFAVRQAGDGSVQRAPQDGRCFLLPQADRGKHIEMGMPEACSFCGASSTDRRQFCGTYVAAICDQCIRE